MLSNHNKMKKYDCYCESIPNIPVDYERLCPKIAENMTAIYNHYSKYHICCNHKCCCNYHCGCNIVVICCKNKGSSD